MPAPRHTRVHTYTPVPRPVSKNKVQHKRSEQESGPWSVDHLHGNIKDMFLKTRLQEMGGLSSGQSLIRGTNHTEASFVHLLVFSRSDHDARVFLFMSFFKDTKSFGCTFSWHTGKSIFKKLFYFIKECSLRVVRDALLLVVNILILSASCSVLL